MGRSFDGMGIRGLSGRDRVLIFYVAGYQSKRYSRDIVDKIKSEEDMGLL